MGAKSGVLASSNSSVMNALGYDVPTYHDSLFLTVGFEEAAFVFGATVQYYRHESMHDQKRCKLRSAS